MLRIGLVTEVKPGFGKVSFFEDEIVSAWLPIVVRGSQENKDCWPLHIDEQVVCLMDDHANDGVIIGAIYSEKDLPPDSAGNKVTVIKFEDGTEIKYDTENHLLKAVVNGDVEISSEKCSVDCDELKSVVTGDAELIAGGKVTVTTNDDVSVSAGGNADITATGNINLTAPLVKVKGILEVEGMINAGGIAVTAALKGDNGSGKMESDGDIETTGELKGGTVKQGDIELGTHVHGGVTTGAGISSGPVQPTP